MTDLIPGFYCVVCSHSSVWYSINTCFTCNEILMLDRKWIIKTKSSPAAKQATSHWEDRQGRGNKGTEEAIFHSGQAAFLMFHMAMQIYSSSQDFTQPDKTTGLTFHSSSFLLVGTTPSTPRFTLFFCWIGQEPGVLTKALCEGLMG